MLNTNKHDEAKQLAEGGYMELEIVRGDDLYNMQVYDPALKAPKQTPLEYAATVLAQHGWAVSGGMWKHAKLLGSFTIGDACWNYYPQEGKPLVNQACNNSLVDFLFTLQRKTMQGI